MKLTSAQHKIELDTENLTGLYNELKHYQRLVVLGDSSIGKTAMVGVRLPYLSIIRSTSRKPIIFQHPFQLLYERLTLVKHKISTKAIFKRRSTKKMQTRYGVICSGPQQRTSIYYF